MVYFYKELRLSFLLSKRSVSLAQKGFTLIEMALVLMVLGLFIGAVISFAEFDDDKRALQETQYRQKKIAVAISDFANRHGHVPCAAYLNSSASDFGWSMTLPACNTLSYNGNSAGYVPYKTLGLSREYAYDGYGRLMTYVVYRPAYEQEYSPNETILPLPKRPVHRNCRLGELNPLHLLNPKMTWVFSGKNINAFKARFCCANMTYVSANTNQLSMDRVIVTDSSNTPVLDSVQYYNNPQILNNHFGPVDTVWNSVKTTDKHMTYFAYMLISHGKNGSWAAIHNPGTTPDRIRDQGDDNQSYYDSPGLSGLSHFMFHRMVRPLSLIKGAEYYDNITLWRTQEQIISETGITDCTKP